MNTEEFAALETIEYKACIDMYRAAPAEIVDAFDIDVQDIDGATCLSCRKINPTMIFRRAVGLGVARAATEDGLDRIADYMQSRGDRFAIPAADAARPAELPDWLEARGLERGYAWMKFSRPCDNPPDAGSVLDVRTVGPDHGADFGAIVTAAFGLPSGIVPWIGALAGRPNWICVLAFAADMPVAAGAAFVDGSYAWLGFGGTLASHRRHGAQSALIVQRLREAAARGAVTAVTETGERLPDLPSNSYRNILRAGFEECYLRQNWLSPETN